MDLEVFLICVFPLSINLGLAIFLVVTVFRERITPTAIALLTLILGASIWSFGYAMEFLAPSLGAKLFWAKFQYFGITSIPLAWFSFSHLYIGSPGWSNRSPVQRILLLIIPALTLALVWTNDLHGLVWRNVGLQRVGPAEALVIEHGPIFWVYLAYSYCLLFVGSVKLIVGMLGTFHLSRWRTMLRQLAILIPWIGNLIYVTGYNPIPNLDWSPLSFSIAGLLFSISLYRHSLIDILPIAQKTVFSVLPDCLLVLDAQDRLIDLNATAQRMVGTSGAWHGRSISEVFPELAHWISRANFQPDFRTEIRLGAEQNQRFYELRIVTLTSFNADPVGRLIVCHEITQHKQAQAQLEQIRDQLERSVIERTTELRETVARLEHELEQRNLAERRFEDVVESAPDAMLLVDHAGTIMLVNAQAERLFGYPRTELLQRSLSNLIATPLRQKHQAYVDEYLTHPSVRQIDPDSAYSAQRKDGATFPVEISLGTLNTSNGPRIVCNIRDITERKKSEEEQNQLLKEIKESHAQLRSLAVRLSEAREFEQRQIAVELHDRVGQNLTGINLNLRVIQNMLTAEEFAPIRRRLEDSMYLVEETTRQVRSVMADLNPPLLEEYGLGAALRLSCEKFMGRTGIETKLTGEDFSQRLPQREEMALFRIIQEGLNNVAKHARATQVKVQIETKGQSVVLNIEDNGIGFDLENLPNAKNQPHWGLLNIQERAASIGGAVQICSTPGQGTYLSVTILKGGAND